MHKCFLTLVVVALLPACAYGIDGQILINQATVLAAGGFPYKITQSGSYKLSGNLIVTNTDAIDITAPNVTLDLNGFAISCTACTLGSAAGINSSGVNTTIRNGTVTGYSALENSGIVLNGNGGRVDSVTANNDYTGILVNSQGTPGVNAFISNSVFASDSDGVVAGTISNPQGGIVTVMNCQFNFYSDGGVALFQGAYISGSSFNGYFSQPIGIIATGSGPAMITNNFFIGNSVAIDSNASNEVYGLNVFQDNNNDVVGPARSMKNNFCSSGSC